MDINKILLDKIDTYYGKQKRYLEPHYADPDAIKKNVQTKPESKLDIQDIKDIVEKLNNSVVVDHERVSFSYHEKTHRIVFKIINEDNEVIREIPAEDSLRLLEHIQEQIGLVVDKVG